MKYNPQIHHRRSIRLKGYDYAQAGAYFITLCCYDKAQLFGEIKNGEMLLNEYGKIARDEWLKTPAIRDNVELDVFVVMPNHMHAIIILTRDGRGELHSPLPAFKSPSNTIGAITRGYKSAVTTGLNRLNVGCSVWQRNYYEHIICNDQSYQHISEYILNNPAKWLEDAFYSP